MGEGLAHAMCEPLGSWAIVAGRCSPRLVSVTAAAFEFPRIRSRKPADRPDLGPTADAQGPSVEGRPQTSQGAVVLRHSAFWSQVVDDGRKGGRDSLLGLLLGHTCVLRDLLDTILPEGAAKPLPSGSEFVPVPTQEDTVSPSPPSFSFETTPPMPPASCTILETAHAAITGSGLSSPILRGETVTRLPESDTAARHDA